MLVCPVVVLGSMPSSDVVLAVGLMVGRGSRFDDVLSAIPASPAVWGSLFVFVHVAHQNMTKGGSAMLVLVCQVVVYIGPPAPEDLPDVSYIRLELSGSISGSLLVTAGFLRVELGPDLLREWP